MGDFFSSPCLRASVVLSRVRLDFADEDEDDDDDEDQAEAAGGVGAPAVAVAPGGESAEEHEDQQDQQDGAKHKDLSKRDILFDSAGLLRKGCAASANARNCGGRLDFGEKATFCLGWSVKSGGGWAMTFMLLSASGR